MPIYAYRCASCGHAKDILQKMSDDPLTVCPQCTAATFSKQLTAAGFQLKGSGWYVTDFRGGNTVAAPADEAAKTDASAPAAPAADAGSATPSAPATTAPTPSATPAPSATKSVAAPAVSTLANS